MFAVGFFIWVCKPNFFDLYFSQIIKLSHFPPQACSCYQSKVYFLLFLKLFLWIQKYFLENSNFLILQPSFFSPPIQCVQLTVHFPSYQHLTTLPNYKFKQNLTFEQITNKKLVFTFTWLTFLYLLFMFFSSVKYLFNLFMQSELLFPWTLVLKYCSLEMLLVILNPLYWKLNQD